MRSKGKINTTAAFLIIIAISILVGFILTREKTPVADTAEYGVEAIVQLKALDEELEEEAQ